MPAVPAVARSFPPDRSLFLDRVDTSMTSAARFSFPRAMRLLKTDEFSSVFSLRRSSGDVFFQMLVAPNGLPHARLGLVVGKKTDKRAVARNYIKRLTRETFRLNATRLAGLDVVIRARRTFGHKESLAARTALLGLFDRAQRWRA